MIRTAPGRIKDARKEIEVMKRTGERIRPLPFGKNNDTLFVSSYRGLLLAFDVVEVDATMYFIGFKKTR